MDFPELPDDLPEGTVRKKWQAFNTIICQAAEPRIEECPIDSAEELAEKIDALRGYEVPSRFRLQKKKETPQTQTGPPTSGCSRRRSPDCLLGGFMAQQQPASAGGTCLGYSSGYPLIRSGRRIPDRIRAGDQLPAGASVYDADGNYLDETPYGPIELPSGSPVAYTIKKSGFADKEEAGTVKGGATLALGGVLKEYHPPYGQPALEGYGGCYVPARRNAPCGARPPLPPPCSTNF